MRTDYIVLTQKDIQLFEWIVGSALLYFSQTTYEDKFSPDTKTNPTNPGQLKLGNKDIKKDSGLGYNKHQRFFPAANCKPSRLGFIPDRPCQMLMCWV